jgi:hypothetical protein
MQELIELGVYNSINSINSINYTDYKDKKIERGVVASLFNMVASRNWENITFTFGNTDLDAKFNGLYMKYLSHCDINAIFKSGDKYGYVSHAGLGNFDSHITNRLGYAYTSTKKYNKSSIPNTATPASLFEIVKSYDIFKKKLSKIMLQKEKNLVNNLKRRNKIVKHIIAMSAASLYTKNNKNDIYMHMMSQIVGTCGPHTPNIPKLNKSIFNELKPIPLYGGHGRDELNTLFKNANNNSAENANANANTNTITNKFKKTRLTLEKDDTTTPIITWNIYGHQPRGITPTVSLAGTKERGTYYICMDVSKIEGQTNENSYAVMIINPDKTAEITGKVDLSTGFITVIKSEQVKKEIKKINYTKNLDEFVECQKKYANINLNLTHDLSSDNSVKNLKRNLEAPVLLKDDKYKYISHTEFMGTSPNPIIKNRLFICGKDEPLINLGQTGQTGQTANPYYAIFNEDFFIISLEGGAKKRMSYAKASLSDLKKYAKQLEIRGRSKMTRDELIESIKKCKRKQKNLK